MSAVRFPVTPYPQDPKTHSIPASEHATVKRTCKNGLDPSMFQVLKPNDQNSSNNPAQIICAQKLHDTTARFKPEILNPRPYTQPYTRTLNP